MLLYQCDAVSQEPWQYCTKVGATRSVTVNTSAFLPSYQCYCTSSRLAFGLNLRSLVCGISEARHQGFFFSPGTPVSSPLSSVNGSANKIKLKGI